ncbi:N-acetylglucosamine-6-phosphate deacetylase [Microseira sp. BLCC-F43]|jgi:N-acetylglucosamine-6-phosphate deacetylase|uniref:N-acetylglucosamine-6-phosphate deacetylase n=1 Tax=Microseira sp. BLCC-F43 TaxID=3153602 RepID=UPI0035BB429A
MTVNLDIFNAHLLGYEGLQMILVDRQGRIKEILPMDTVSKRVAPTDLKGLNVAGDWISLGGVDLQINGALGLPFPDLTPKNADRLSEICQFLWQRGVDGFLPTLVTSSVPKIPQSLAVLADFAAKQPEDSSAAKMLGVHLEGPFLNPQKRGAHPAEFLSPLTIDNVKRVLGDYAQMVKVMTLAPELDSTGEVIPYLRSLGITVSLGHSMATAAQAQQAFELGARMVTHTFNAMPPLHHREPGLLGAALVHRDVWCGLIADGEHVCPIMLELLLRASRSPRAPLTKGGSPLAPLAPNALGGCVFLVSDALAPLGLPDGIYPWDNREIEVKNGTARLPDGTLAGTTLPLLVGVQNLVKWGICEVEEAIALATVAPRHAIGLTIDRSERSHEIPTKKDKTNCDYLGQPANRLLRWHWEKSTSSLTWQRLQKLSLNK